MPGVPALLLFAGREDPVFAEGQGMDCLRPKLVGMVAGVLMKVRIA